jgi:cell division protein FtsL
VIATVMEQKRAILIASALTVASILTAIVCVYARHESRQLFTELQHLNAGRDALEVQWGQLQIEQSTWSSHSRVEEQARTKMQMRNPEPVEIRIVTP